MLKRAIGRTVTTLLTAKPAARTVTAFLNPKLTVRATRRREGRKFNNTHIEVVVTIGRPNHEAREFIRKCRKAGEPFPVKKLQIRHLAR